MKNIAIIPARSGSKGLHDKNIIDLNGYPLMYYTIKAALESKIFDTVMVSTDSHKYACIAQKYGAEVPFLRTNETASDSASSWDMVREVLSNYYGIGKKFDKITLLQPTSPLRDYLDIRNIWKEMIDSNSCNAVSVTEVDHPVQWCFKLPDDGMMDEMASSPYNYIRRQELDLYYRENGAIYIVDANKIMDREYNFYSDKCKAYIMEKEKSVDIDSNIDLMVASVIMQNKIQNEILCM